MNQSKDDPTVGQYGKVYFMNTRGIRKARDLISGKVYQSTNGEDIQIQVQPQQTVVLEILEERPVNIVGVKYRAGDKLLGYENIPAEPGQQVTVFAKNFDGYKLVDQQTKQLLLQLMMRKTLLNLGIQKICNLYSIQVV